MGDRGWRNRPLVRERDAGRVRGLWRTALAIFVALAPTAVYLVNQNECLRLSYQVNRLKTDRESLRDKERLLRGDLSQLESLTEIERWASRQSGLVKPEDRQVVVVPRSVPDAPELVASARDGD